MSQDPALTDIVPPPSKRKGNLRCVVVGAGGYAGAELIDLLLSHPAADVVGVFGSDRLKAETEAAGGLFSEFFPRFRGRFDMQVRPTDAATISSLRPDAIFLATPHEASEKLAPEMMKLAACVLDLSAAYRFADSSIYPKYYGFEHTHPGVLQMAAYGLPELFRDKLISASLIAVPGCYPTSAILPLAPLVRAGALATGTDGRLTRPIIDSTSGVSGAGRSLKQGSLFCEVSLQAYGVFKHRHGPEIDAYCGTPTIFTPHLGAYDRGILSTIHVELAEGWTGTRVSETLLRAYDREPFVRLCSSGVWPALADVRHTNFCDIGWEVEPAGDSSAGRHLIMVSAIDNLGKGAAGQAVQAMNARFGLPETSGLLIDRHTEFLR